ncbi:MFS transporter [Filibacter tadaridae]|uniref:Tetracycline resistance protein, class B n=1 Tax=Filibacter tadaridae TaxID=2483811 RepID=A0A3P5X6L2_9BACL|nr:MFS transporter [Filibacter tadaridae]VDC29913.1 Tetracycline resistance protein, class B [Filibacter tadaridae]
MAAKSNNFALYILMFNMFITMSGIGLIIPIMPEYLGTFGVAGQALGFMIAMFSFSQFIFSPIAGDLSDKHGRKKLIIFGLIIFGLSQLTFGLSTELWMLYASRFFSGLGSAFLVPPMMAFVVDVTTYEERGRGMGLLGASMSLGFMIGPAIGGFLSKISLEFPFYVATTAALTAATISFFALPNPAPHIKAEPGTEKKRENLLMQLKRSATKPYFIMLIVMFVFSFGLANFQATISLYVDQKYGYTPSQIAVLITVGGFVGVIAQTFVINRLFKRFGEMRVILVNLVVAAIAMIGILAVDSFWTILLVATLFFTATSLLRPAVNTLVSKLAGSEQGFAAGMMTAYMSLGNMVGPALAGIMFDINIAYPYIIGTIILLICFTIASFWSKRNGELLTGL